LTIINISGYITSAITLGRTKPSVALHRDFLPCHLQPQFQSSGFHGDVVVPARYAPEECVAVLGANAAKLWRLQH
jgi:hypothetical protein